MNAFTGFLSMQRKNLREKIFLVNTELLKTNSQKKKKEKDHSLKKQHPSTHDTMRYCLTQP